MEVLLGGTGGGVTATCESADSGFEPSPSLGRDVSAGPAPNMTALSRKARREGGLGCRVRNVGNALTILPVILRAGDPTGGDLRCGRAGVWQGGAGQDT